MIYVVYVVALIMATTIRLMTLFYPDIDYGQPRRRTYGDNVTYTDWHKDNYFYVINQLAGQYKIIAVCLF